MGIGTTSDLREAAEATLPYHSGRGEERKGDIPRFAGPTWEARVDLIGAILTAIAGVLVTAFSKQVADEFKAWVPRLVAAVIRCAVRRLREDQRDRYAEEWRSHIDETPGEIGKLIVGLGLLPAAWKLSRISPKPRALQIEDIVIAMRDQERSKALIEKIPSKTGKFIFRFMTLPALLKRSHIIDEAFQLNEQRRLNIDEMNEVILRLASEKPGDPILQRWAADFEKAWEKGYRESAVERNLEPSVLAAEIAEARARRPRATVRPYEREETRSSK